MRVVQIAGPSYSGSTALGYILNAADGWFFGSEVYRMLPAWRTTPEREQRARCSHCGEACPYWHRDLRDGLRALPSGGTVADVYALFSRTHPTIGTFVDGSKDLAWYQVAWGPVQLVAAKHPLRMVTSYLYNRAERFDLPHEPTFRQFRRTARERHADMHAAAARALSRLRREYTQLLERAPHPILCRTDELHLDDFAELRRVASRLGVAADPAMVTRFTDHEVHPVGGNRALVWVSQEKGRTLTRAERHGARRRYYVEGGGDLGDYRVDDKYQQLLNPSLRGRIVAEPAYQQLCQLLGYNDEPTAGPAGPVSGR